MISFYKKQSQAGGADSGQTDGAATKDKKDEDVIDADYKDLN